MGTLLRSEEMNLVQLFIQPEAAYHIVAELGEMGCVQFKDLNEDVNLFQREYSMQVKTANELERQLKYIEAEIKKEDIPIPDITSIPKAPNYSDIVNLEVYLDKTEREIREMSESEMVLRQEYYQGIQQKHVLEKAQIFLNQQEEAVNSDDAPDHIRNSSQLGYVAGVINKEKLFSFERMLWRIGRGNIFIRNADIEEPIEDPTSRSTSRKTSFIAFFQGENLANKINKICVGFHVTIVNVPVEWSSREERIKRLTKDIGDVKDLLDRSIDHKRKQLLSVVKEIQNWSIMVRKIKAIYTTMNLFSHDVSRKCLIAEGWIPTSDLYYISTALKDGSVACGSSVQSFFNILTTTQTPPTYNRANKFTQGFQNLIEAYAFSSYRELNPALYTIVTFPFLFAIMFGDLGHGFIMLSFGLWMVLSEKKIMEQKNKNEIFSIFFGGRYIIVLMGIFSIYTGFIYNDLFSKSINIFGSKWKIANLTDLELTFNFSSNEENEASLKYTLKPLSSYEGTPYIAGVDPVWQDAENKIIFLNSFKMKLSILFGVVHMIFGLSLSVVNFLHFRKPVHIVLDFLPKLLFFGFLFVYLLIMMIMKWANYSAMNDDNIDTPYGSGCAPSVLIFFIGMILFKASEHVDGCNPYMFEGQEVLQHVFVVLAVLCIPWMLLGVPLYEMTVRKKKNVAVYQNDNVENYVPLEIIPESSVLNTHKEEEEEEEPMSELVVHAAIHTIEFTLSTVSHTASYLRLWALSLAHAQLSEVLWQMVFKKALVINQLYVGGVFIYIIFFAWSSITVGILVLMEGLSAFLHTLRLHWVEFMTKFFEGQGYGFEPFSFKRLLDDNVEGENE
ncbi:V-type proton ATPase 116 kDa subunit a 1-like [Euwallacea fornicatus]|uniref:V-type proton ATPase 116 kDa subunit a 1-like n=1 Tax=Euwallacea fornicatus TaxID=995702 RepID=UPI00338D8A0C